MIEIISTADIDNLVAGLDTMIVIQCYLSQPIDTRCDCEVLVRKTHAQFIINKILLLTGKNIVCYIT